ncbi:MAG: hypothetical protein CL607_26235 [Anaerolineaceae bacterium]|nr:hypothetical protein [Anaerolineaceae bacterium]
MTFQQQARDAIRDSGGRITPQREILFDLLSHVEEDIDADGLYRLAAQQDPNISLPTVYRTLNTLEDAEVIASQYVSTDHERKVYRVNDKKDVFHFTCSRCGKVTQVTSHLVDKLRQELGSQIGADVLTVCMCAGGLCEDCRKEAQIMTLDQLQNGQPAKVVKITGKGAVRRRLMDMGLVRGVQVEMVKAAPMGDPVDYLVRGYHLSLRKSEAQMIEIDLG